MRIHFLRIVSSSLKLLTFRLTTALQRCMPCGFLPQEREYYIINFFALAKIVALKFGGAAGSEGMSQGRTSEEANSASVGVTLFATSRFVEGGSLRKSYLSNDIAAADICRRERGRSLGIPKRLFSRAHLLTTRIRRV